MRIACIVVISALLSVPVSAQPPTQPPLASDPVWEMVGGDGKVITGPAGVPMTNMPHIGCLQRLRAYLATSPRCVKMVGDSDKGL